MTWSPDGKFILVSEKDTLDLHYLLALGRADAVCIDGRTGRSNYDHFAVGAASNSTVPGTLVIRLFHCL